MNLYLRFFYIIIAGLMGRKIDVMDVSKIKLRCWPNDLDLNFHMNNGRYLTIMDIGRTDLIVRSGLAGLVRKHRWYPVVGAQTISFFRAIKPFAKFELHTRLTGWDERWFYLEQEFYVGKKLCASAVVKAMFLGPDGQVLPEVMAKEMNVDPNSPSLSAEAQALQHQDRDERRQVLKQKTAA